MTSFIYRMAASCVAFAAMGLCATADIWHSIDGKAITADFEMLEGETVVLSMNGKSYRLPLDRLHPTSREYAKTLDASFRGHVKKFLTLPILPERVLLNAISLEPKSAEGRNYLVSGRVASVGRFSSLSRGSDTTAQIRLEGGAVATMDFTSEADGRRTKLRFEPDRIIQMKARRLDGTWKSFTPEKTLIEVGQQVVVRAQVRGGHIVAQNVASSAEIAEANIEAAKVHGANPEQIINSERLKIRLAFLEAQLEGPAGSASVSGVTGYIGSVTLHHTEAEKEAMRKELELLQAQLSAAAKP